MSCPVCFSPADPVVTESLNGGIFVLLGVTGAVLAGFAAFMVSLARRATRHEMPAPEPMSFQPPPLVAAGVIRPEPHA